ncbi:MAG: hypothetical protein K0U86_09940, partial [Planctomycetes bacterium]|nr:hypothetical protein [Planctomycetota bacterium]
VKAFVIFSSDRKSGAHMILSQVKTKRFSAVWILCSLITFCILWFSYHIYGSFPSGLGTVACFLSCTLGDWYELEIRRVLFGDTPMMIISDDTRLILFWHVIASCLIGLALALITLMAIKPANKEKEELKKV